MKQGLLIGFVSLFLCSCGKLKEKSDKSVVVNAIEIDTLSVVQQIEQYRLNIDFSKEELESFNRDIYNSSENDQIKAYYKKMLIP